MSLGVGAIDFGSRRVFGGLGLDFTVDFDLNCGFDFDFDLDLDCGFDFGGGCCGDTLLVKIGAKGKSSDGT